MNHELWREFLREKVIPVAWLMGCSLLIGAEVGLWLRG